MHRLVQDRPAKISRLHNSENQHSIATSRLACRGAFRDRHEMWGGDAVDVEGLDLTSGPDRGRRSGVVLTPQGSGVKLASAGRLLLVRISRQRFIARPNKSGPASRMRVTRCTHDNRPASSRALIASATVERAQPARSAIVS